MKYVTLSVWFTLSLILQLAVIIVPKQRIKHIINKDEPINTESTPNQIKRQMVMSSVTSYITVKPQNNLSNLFIVL